jgi:hypothetical protein
VVPDDHRLADDLDRYWDATLRGEAPARPGGIDEISAAIIARLREPTESRYLADAQQRVRQQVVESTTTVRPPVIPSPESDLENRERMSRLNVRGAPRTVLILAATILLALGVALAIDILREPNPDRGGGPVIHAPATPSPEASPSDTVFEITLPAEAIPHTNARFIALEHDTISPGADAHWTPYWGTGPYMEFVVSGSFTARIEADTQVLRADGTREAVPASADVILGQGDTLISRNEYPMETINTGTAPAETLIWVFIDDPGDHFSGRTGQDGRIGRGFTLISDFQGDMPNLPGDLPDLPGAVTMRLQRLELAPDEPVYPPTGEVHLALTMDITTESVLRAGDGTYFKASNIKGEPTTVVYLLTVIPADTPEP